MQRLRKFRKDSLTRERYAEVKLAVEDFIYPYFIVEGEGIKQEITSLKDVYHLSIDQLLIDFDEVYNLGIHTILLFGVIDESLKDNYAHVAYQDNNLVARAVKAIKEKYDDVTVITDVCLCGYTRHGHCGVVRRSSNNNVDVDNDETLPLLAKMALTHARGGADYVAPSAMMDGQVGAIRHYLNQEGFNNTKILSYSVKYASHFYEPFRDAVQSAPLFGDRKTYQMDYRTIQQAIDEVAADVEEGADWIMVKPAQNYLDIIQRIKQTFPHIPLVAYQVSGEYMMIKVAAQVGYLQEAKTMYEVLIGIKRAGADKIISYYAKDFAKNAFELSAANEGKEKGRIYV